MISSEVTASLNFAFVDDDFDDGSDFRGCWGIVELLVEEEEDPASSSEVENALTSGFFVDGLLEGFNFGEVIC